MKAQEQMHTAYKEPDTASLSARLICDCCKFPSQLADCHAEMEPDSRPSGFWKASAPEHNSQLEKQNLPLVFQYTHRDASQRRRLLADITELAVIAVLRVQLYSDAALVAI